MDSHPDSLYLVALPGSNLSSLSPHVVYGGVRTGVKGTPFDPGLTIMTNFIENFDVGIHLFLINIKSFCFVLFCFLEGRLK